MKVLVIRNDKLGDFMLAYPSFALAKSNLINPEIHALVPEYTREMAECCPYIDRVIVDPGRNSGFKENINLLKKIKQEKYDAVITLFSTTRIGLLTLLAGIPYRLAPATKIAQIFYNHKLVQHRSRSEKPEYAYNMDLIKYFLKYLKIADIKSPSPPYLSFDKKEIDILRKRFITVYNIPDKHKLIFIHAGSGGSAVNLTPIQYSQLANSLNSTPGHTFILSAGPGEQETAQVVANNITNAPYIIFESKNGIVDFAKHIQFADLFISGSTGPLHIAGALNINTAGFYPRRRSATPLRWQTLNSDKYRIAFSPDSDAEQEDMSSIDVKQCANKISSYFNF